MVRQRVCRLCFILLVIFALLATASAQGTPPVHGRGAPTPTPPSVASPLPAEPSNQSQTASPSTVTNNQAAPVSEPDLLYGRQGVLVQTSDGQAVTEQAADQLFNPASTLKLGTALVALRTFGPQHRFATGVWTNGAFNPATSTITGDLIISGRDPSFHYEHAIDLARELNQLGIRTVTGDLIVAPGFTMNFSGSALRSGERLYDTLDVMRRPAAATRAWYDERLALGDPVASLQNAPSVAVMGAVYVSAVPPGARLLLTQRSSPLVDILKVLLCYSNNFMAERLGDALGGPSAVRRVLISDIGINPMEISMETTSGRGVNRLTPRAMMKIYRALVAQLSQEHLAASDIMPVAGIDPGTLQKRYTVLPSRGSVIAKTGTLGRTDGGASALVGQMRTQSGETLFFVIFNQHGRVLRFRAMQDQLVTQIQYAHGGPAPFAYAPHTLAMRLADTELDAGKSTSTEEYEPVAN